MPARRFRIALLLLPLAACEPVPELGALQPAGGVVERVWPGPAGGAWQVRVAGDDAVHTLPAPEQPLAPGDTLRLWLDREAGEVWHATAGGRAVVSYERRAATLRRENTATGWLVGGLALFVLVGLPLAEGLAFRERLRKPLVEAAAADLEPHQARDLAGRAAELQSLGFEPAGLFMERSGGTSAVWALFRNARHGEAAVAASVTVPAGTSRATHRFTAFATSFASGATVHTSNGTVLSSFPAPPGRFAGVLPGELRLGRLLAAHRALCRIHVPGGTGGVLPDDLAAWFAAEPARELESAQRAGWLRPGAGPDEVRLSARGLLLRLPARTWPVQPVRRWTAVRRTRRLLRGDPRWRAETAAVPPHRSSDAEAAAALARLAGGPMDAPLPAEPAGPARGGLWLAAVLTAVMLALPLWIGIRGVREAARPASDLHSVTGVVRTVELRAPQYVSAPCAMIHLRGADGTTRIYRARMMCPDEPIAGGIAAGDRLTLWTPAPDSRRAWRVERGGRVLLHEDTQRTIFRRLAWSAASLAVFPLLLLLLLAAPALLRRMGITGREDREPMSAGLSAVAWTGGGIALLPLLYLLTPINANAATARPFLMGMCATGAAMALGAVLLHHARTRAEE